MLDDRNNNRKPYTTYVVALSHVLYQTNKQIDVPEITKIYMNINKPIKQYGKNLKG